MKMWLDTYLGTDAATYLGLFVGVIALFAVQKVVKIRKSENIKQSAKNTNGNVYQAGGDINQTINNLMSGDTPEYDNLKKKSEHDLKIIEEILMLLPYKETKGWLEQSYLSGFPRDICLNMEKAEGFYGENYRLYNHDVNDAKDRFIQSITSFVESTMPFLHVDYPNRTPLMLNLPHDWKYKGQESESKFREYQGNMKKTSGIMIECYDDFIKVFKANGFVTDKL